MNAKARLREASKQLDRAREALGTTDALTVTFINESDTLCRLRFEETETGQHERIEEYHDGDDWQHRGSELVTVEGINRTFK